jgi:hypothetical protein
MSDFADFTENILDLFFLDGQLIFVIKMLVAATAACAVIGTQRPDAPGRRCDDTAYSAAQKSFFYLRDDNFQFITFGGKWHKNNKMIDPGDTVTAERD